MEHLWAPWRAQYIRESAAQPSVAVTPCFICNGLAQSQDRQNVLLWRRPHTVVYLNRFPYNNGHLLVAPTDHRASLLDFEAQDLLEPMETIQRCLTILQRTLNPHGYNIGINLGKTAGAGLPGHLHWHIVPRWEGDSNFMPVVANTKVIVESLEAFYDLWQTELKAIENRA